MTTIINTIPSTFDLLRYLFFRVVGINGSGPRGGRESKVSTNGRWLND